MKLISLDFALTSIGSVLVTARISNGRPVYFSYTHMMRIRQGLELRGIRVPSDIPVNMTAEYASYIGASAQANLSLVTAKQTESPEVSLA